MGGDGVRDDCDRARRDALVRDGAQHGASPMRIFLAIDVPQARGALAAAFILSFILSWDEFGFALLLQVTNRTLPPLLYYYTVFGDVGPASALALLIMLPAIGVVVALRPMLRGALMTGGLR